MSSPPHAVVKHVYNYTDPLHFDESIPAQIMAAILDNFVAQNLSSHTPVSAIQSIKKIAERFSIKEENIDAKQIAQHGNLYLKFLERHFEVGMRYEVLGDRHQVSGVRCEVSGKADTSHLTPHTSYLIPKFPVQTHIKNRLFQTTLDALIILPNETSAFIISDVERSSAKPVQELANRHTLTLFLSRQVLQNNLDTRQVDCYLHLPLQGAIAKIEFV